MSENPQTDQDWLDKLTKKAREEIVRLRANVDYLARKLSEGPENSNAFLDPHSGSPRPLGRNPVLKFNAPENDWSGFVVEFKDGELLIQGMAPSHEDYFGVFPMSGNYVAIKHVKKNG